jgi:hypothetical protein
MLKFDKPLEAKGYRPLQMNFDDQPKALIFFHLEEYESGRELLAALDNNDFAKECVAPPNGIKKSAFFEAINNRGLEVFRYLVKEAAGIIPPEYAHLGNLVAIDDALANSLFSVFVFK